ncbi:MAG: LuxR C-terminal-related transcriptional regulator [Burkholderiales bacterium]|nr:LuxR C-terminal-related transcriptional regulator [Burkholderiales bacterium]
MVQTMQRSLLVDSHYALLNWLRKDVKRLIPHDAVIAAWGDFSLGLVCHDVVSPLQDMRTASFGDQRLQPYTSWLFRRWKEHDYQPFVNEAFNDSAFQGLDDTGSSDTLHEMQTGLVHGIKDQRGRHDCLYVLLCDGPIASSDKALQALRFLLPYIDAAFRQIAHLPGQYYEKPRHAAAPPEDQAGDAAGAMTVSGLSTREKEIMDWVRLGKTNLEIGMILDISAFTVKNHMQRIFKKLDVLNRAQAVAKVDTYRHAQPTK